ncbi:MAG: hypothetical protein IPM75_19070 [Candidatus Competibacteraceae bacterium]|nr:hypothetical protein [Candidatus Competibacteraceae bacterium]
MKAHLLIDLRGVAVGVTITPANVDERTSAKIASLSTLTACWPLNR